MNILSKKSLPLGGFAGLTEHRLVTDLRVFGSRKAPNTFDGIGNFVYLADAQFNPHGQTHMHSHKEIDVISIMMNGRVSHEGSLEHGQSLNTGEAQVQRAGGEGFSHNEINPDEQENHMIQLWVLPDVAGQPAGYKVYRPLVGQSQRIYGGNQGQDETFNSQTLIDVANLEAGQRLQHEGELMLYLSDGAGQVNGQSIEARTLVRFEQGMDFTADESAQLILISQI